MPQTPSQNPSSSSRPAPKLPATFGELRKSQDFSATRVSRSVKDELRENLIRRLQEQAASKDGSLAKIIGRYIA